MVLIVEDDAISRRALAHLLQSYGYRTQAVGSAEEAISVLDHGESPSAVLLDIDLPGMNGLDLARRLSGTHPQLVLLFVTASEDRLAELSRGYPGQFFRKPLDITGLLTAIGLLPAV